MSADDVAAPTSPAAAEPLYTAAANERVLHSEAHTALYVDSQLVAEDGTLEITSEAVVLRLAAAADADEWRYALPSISLHAVSKDTTLPPHKPAIYCQVESDKRNCVPTAAVSTTEPAEDVDEEAAEGDDAISLTSTVTSELHFVPADSSSLEQIYAALCSAAELHPTVDDQQPASDEDEWVTSSKWDNLLQPSDSNAANAEGEAADDNNINAEQPAVKKR